MKKLTDKLIRLTAKIALLLALGGGLTACATNPVSGGQDLVLMSEAQEIELGKKNHEQILQEYARYDDPQVQAMVNRIGQELAHHSHRPNLNFTFTVLDSPEVNAFALPGGYVYITRGIMVYLNDEEQLAGVLGHEIGHVTARHSVRQQTAQTATGLIGVLAAAATGSDAVAQTTNYLGSALVSGYGRGHELEADRLGAEYLARINYDPESMLDVIEVLKNQELFSQEQARANGKPAPPAYHGLFATHPDNDQRLQEVISAAKNLQGPERRHANAEDYLHAIDGMTFGESESQGVVRSNQFFHRDLNLAISFPQDWQLINQPDRLIGVSPDKQQLIQFVLGDANAGSPPAYLNKIFPQLHSAKAHGQNIYSGVAQVDSPWGKRNARVATIRYDGKTLILIGTGRNKVPNQTFFETAASVGPLNAEQRKRATGKKIRLIRAKRGDTFADWAKRSNIEKLEVSRLRLLNGLYPQGEPLPGQLIKIVK